MDDLIAFLTARLDEDEWIAKGAARNDDNGQDGHWLPVHFAGGGFDARVDDHIARHDPARVLREVMAKRWMVERAQDANAAERGMAMTVLRYLAMPHDAHPDYRAEWKP